MGACQRFGLASRHASGVGGTRPPRLPWGEREGGFTFSFLAAAGCFALRRSFLLLSQPPTRPASIRTLCGASAPVPVGVLTLKRVLPSLYRTERFLPERLVPPRPRSHPNPAILQ